MPNQLLSSTHARRPEHDPAPCRPSSSRKEPPNRRARSTTPMRRVAECPDGEGRRRQVAGRPGFGPLFGLARMVTSGRFVWDRGHGLTSTVWTSRHKPSSRRRLTVHEPAGLARARPSGDEDQRRGPPRRRLPLDDACLRPPVGVPCQPSTGFVHQPSQTEARAPRTTTDSAPVASQDCGGCSCSRPVIGPGAPEAGRAAR